MANTIDLHTHSTASDGLYPPADLVRRAAGQGLKVLALTDHDTTEGLKEAYTEAEKQHIELIPGIELNTDIDGGEVHVLGYYLDYQQNRFQDVLQQLRAARVQRGQRMVEKLNAAGIHISWDRVRHIAEGTVGRPHIAKALIEAGYAQSVGEAFEKYIGNGRVGYVPRYKLSPVDAVRLIASVNGLPVVAHPLKIPGLVKLKVWLPRLLEAGLVGLETYYGPYTPQEEREVKAVAAEYGLIPTGGTDYHGPNIHPTPLGGRYVPEEAVTSLKAAAAKRYGRIPTPFELSAPLEDR